MTNLISCGRAWTTRERKWSGTWLLGIPGVLINPNSTNLPPTTPPIIICSKCAKNSHLRSQPASIKILKLITLRRLLLSLPMTKKCWCSNSSKFMAPITRTWTHPCWMKVPYRIVRLISIRTRPTFKVSGKRKKVIRILPPFRKKMRNPSTKMVRKRIRTRPKWVT